jgi:PTH1 family peptidyl-tRNA hydrolase
VRVIVGIGNPGSRYKNNRHNVGFQFLDFFCEKKKLLLKASKLCYHFSEGQLSGDTFVLIRPDTYVNNSGLAVLECIKHYKLDVVDVLVVVDDINLDLADIRIRKSGGDGGHNGLSSIIYNLQSKNFPRLRIGIGSNFQPGNLAEYVLSDFGTNDFIQIEKTFNISIQLAESFISDGYNKMLNTFSRLIKTENFKSNLE